MNSMKQSILLFVAGAMVLETTPLAAETPAEVELRAAREKIAQLEATVKQLNAVTEKLRLEVNTQIQAKISAQIELLTAQARNIDLEQRAAKLARENARLLKALGAKAPIELKPTVPNPPNVAVEGKVKSVDGASGLMALTVGSDAGLQKGHTLELFRLMPKPQYLGMVMIVEVTPTQAVAKPVGKMAAPPAVGDSVASSITGK